MSGDIASKHRSEIIERSINIEWLMAAVISQHYFKFANTSFLFDVLYDEQCSFSLKRRIIEKITTPNKINIQSLNRLSTIRNYFAHCNQEVANVSAPNDFFVPDPRNPEKPVDFASLYEEFTRIAPSIEQSLLDCYREKGGKAFKEIPK
jgi:hypothetical protein